MRIESFAVPDGARPHDVAPTPGGPDGSVWYTAQRQGALGRLDPKTGETVQIPLGEDSKPHGVIVGPDGFAWVTDSGLNAIVSVHPDSLAVTVYPLPEGSASANLNTPAFGGDGRLWFTGQAGIYGSLDPATGTMRVFEAPRGYGPYGIHHRPDGEVWFSSLAGSYIARIEAESGAVEVFDPPTADAGARRVWSDSKGILWVSEWNAGQLARFDPETGAWREWALPGDDPSAYAVYVDETDMVWISDFGANAVLRFDPGTESFDAFPIPRKRADVRQMLGRAGEVWTAESGTDRLTIYRYD
ncbi:MAG: lyase [Rhodospirillaceae bacterium]|nr:lyase [Rhodospirillaceae bacterium]MBT6116853.1 lyase [Rhodospirillaceae bacterium]